MKVDGRTDFLVITMLNQEMLKRVYESTEGFCYFCGHSVIWACYGEPHRRGAWAVQFGQPLSRGGHDDLSNLHPSCVRCDHRKGNMTTAEYRRVLP